LIPDTRRKRYIVGYASGPRNRVVAVKGSDFQSTPVNAGTAVDVKTGKRKIRRGLTLYTIGVSILKQELYGWLRHDKPEGSEKIPYGFCRFPEYNEDHFKRLTAETLETKWIKGRKKYEWDAHNKRNEQLDCRVYSRAATCLIGMDRFAESKWVSLENDVGYMPEKSDEVDDPKIEKLKRKRPRVTIKWRKSKFMQR